jgi:hypothetical protein
MYMYIYRHIAYPMTFIVQHLTLDLLPDTSLGYLHALKLFIDLNLGDLVATT